VCVPRERQAKEPSATFLPLREQPAYWRWMRFKEFRELVMKLVGDAFEFPDTVVTA
jgi:hypothetical protein